MKRIKIKSINSEKLKERGFRYTENGYELQIKDTFRFNHYLVILPNDIYGYAVKRQGITYGDMKNSLRR